VQSIRRFRLRLAGPKRYARFVSLARDNPSRRPTPSAYTDDERDSIDLPRAGAAVVEGTRDGEQAGRQVRHRVGIDLDPRALARPDSLSLSPSLSFSLTRATRYTL